MENLYLFFGFLTLNMGLIESISRSVKIYRKRKKITTTLLFHVLSVVLGLFGIGHLFFAGLSIFCYSYLYKWESKRLHSNYRLENIAAGEYMGTYAGLLLVASILCLYSLIGLIIE